ncbi:unnamed protein product [Closterium sp. Yama58-4]|nr:unnamed protein product [Closterium sp. Yama58-4]
MAVCKALAEVEAQLGVFDSIVVNYCHQEPLSRDIIIAFPHLGFRLCFDPHVQRLHRIDVTDISRLHLRFGASLLGGPMQAPTFAHVYSVLGPTFPGAYNAQCACYTLSYPGMALLFPIPAPHQHLFQHPAHDLPMHLPDGSAPRLSRVLLHLPGEPPLPVQGAGGTGGIGGAAGAGDAGGTGGTGVVEGGEGDGLRRAAERFASLPLVMANGAVYMETLLVQLGEAVLFSQGGQRIAFGDSAQVSRSHKPPPTCPLSCSALPTCRFMPSPSTPVPLTPLPSLLSLSPGSSPTSRAPCVQCNSLLSHSLLTPPSAVPPPLSLLSLSSCYHV